MTRTKEIAGKVERLQSALKRAEALEAGTVLDAQPMCDLVGFSWPIVKGWCNDNPVLEKPELFKRGGNGIKWQFKPVPFITALLDLFLADAEAKTEANAQLRRKLGVDLPEVEQTASLDDTRKLLSMSFDVIDRRNSMGLYVRADAMCDFLEGFCRAVSDGIMGVGAEIDPTGSLEPAVRKKVNDALIGVQGRAHSEVQKYVEGHRARIQQARVSSGG